MDADLAPPAGSCLVYSLGGNNEWSFEKDIIKQLKCEVCMYGTVLMEKGVEIVAAY